MIAKVVKPQESCYTLRHEFPRDGLMAQFARFKKTAFLLIAPQLVMILVFFIWPACSALMQAFFFADVFGLQQRFAGFGNFFDLLQDPSYFQAIKVTLLMAFFVTGLTLVLGLLLAVLVNFCRKGQAVYKSLLLWPYAVAPAVAAILWRFLCQPEVGWLARVCQSLGFDFNYLIYPQQALFVIIVTAIWQQVGYNFLFFFVALKAIPAALLEAAILDGASAWRRFWQIIFPLLSPTTFFLAVMNLIYAFFETFGIIDVLTHGGPENKTSTLIYKVYQDGFIAMDPGSSAAQSVLLMIFVSALTLWQFFYLDKKVHYT